MRKIEQEMTEAILALKDFKKDNTEVINQSEEHSLAVTLFNNLIYLATPDGRDFIQSCGFSTATTRSRLNAILSALEYPGHVYIKQFQMYYHDPTNSRPDTPMHSTTRIYL